MGKKWVVVLSANSWFYNADQLGWGNITLSYISEEGLKDNIINKSADYLHTKFMYVNDTLKRFK